MIESRFQRSKTAVTNIGYPIIWCPKYRRKILIGELAKELEILLKQKASELGIELEQCEIMDDHIHLFVRGARTIPISKIVQSLKGYSSRKLRQQFPALHALPSLWTRSYYCETIGHISKETIEKYIKDQKTR